MRKEFEENEELRKTLENNLETQDEIDDETFQKILEEEFIEREKQIEEALFADEDFEDLELSDEEVRDSYQELMRRFEKEKKEKKEISEELVPAEKTENSDAHRDESTSRKVLPLEEVRERRKNGHELHRLGKVAGMAVVVVACVFAASMTSEANRKYLVNSVRIWSGDDTKTIAYNDSNNEDVNSDEDKAIADIEEELGVKIPTFYYRPYGMEFVYYIVEPIASLARMEYSYKQQCITLYIDKQGESTASKINSMSGEEEDIFVVNNEGTQISIRKVDDEIEDFPGYLAEWKQEDTVYHLSGRIELEEIKKIVKEMKF